MAKKKNHRKYRPKMQRQQARPESPIVQRLKLINQLAPQWFIKAMAMIVLLGVALGVVLLVLLVAREVAWVIRQGNKEKMGMEEDEE